MAESMQPRGMVNTGVTCYLNSAMQALASCSALAEVLHTASEVLELPTAQHQTKTDLAREFEDVFRLLRNGGQPGARPVQTNDFVHAVHGLTRALEGLHQQQDTQEFVCALLDTLHEQLKRPLSEHELEEMRNRLKRRWRECTGEEWQDEAQLAYEEQLKKRQEGKGKRDDGIAMAAGLPPPPRPHMSIISHLFEGAQQRAPPPTVLAARPRLLYPPVRTFLAVRTFLIWACTPSRTHLHARTCSRRARSPRPTGQLLSRVTCCGCSSHSWTADPFLSLSLPLPKTKHPPPPPPPPYAYMPMADYATTSAHCGASDDSMDESTLGSTSGSARGSGAAETPQAKAPRSSSISSWLTSSFRLPSALGLTSSRASAGGVNGDAAAAAAAAAAASDMRGSYRGGESGFTLHDALCEFFAEETIAGDDSYRCEKCKALRKATKVLRLSPPPLPSPRACKCSPRRRHFPTGPSHPQLASPPLRPSQALLV
jgi:hypothetical protein